MMIVFEDNQILNSSGTLNFPQVQNDIYFDPVQLAAPEWGQRRLIVQSLNSFSAIAYMERWLGKWFVATHMPANIKVSTPDLADKNLDFKIQISPNLLVNPDLEGPVVTGFLLPWNLNWKMTCDGPPGPGAVGMWYIAHEPRQDDQVYMNPIPTALPEPIKELTWGFEFTIGMWGL